MANKKLGIITSALIALIATSASADNIIEWNAQTNVTASSGTFAPYFISSNSGGLYTQPFSIIERGRIGSDIDTTHRFSWAFKLDVAAGWSSRIDYERYDASSKVFITHGCAPKNVILQELWGEVKYRGVYLTVGQASYDAEIFPSLGSGDLTLSKNARPIPGVRAGFVNFQNIPFTHGYVQIQGDLSYGKFTDGGWLREHYNRYNNFITTGAWFHHADVHFRTDPRQPFSVTVGMQHAAQFGGTLTNYYRGEKNSSETQHVGIKDFFKILIPRTGGTSGVYGDDAYYYGNHLGSWDLTMRYRLRSGLTITLYAQSPWEDGSGIGKLNGFDGRWGLSVNDTGLKWLKEATLEYLDFTNHSGPIHWDMEDHPGTAIPGEATGADEYYNNFFYNGWANYGMSIGSPFMRSPLYNTDGYMGYLYNRVKGFHLGATGSIMAGLDWKAFVSYRRSSGTPYMPALKHRDDTSFLFGADYSFRSVKGLYAGLSIALDAGSLYGASSGVFATLSYKGNIAFKNRKK